MSQRAFFGAALLFVSTLCALDATAQTKLLRYPDLQGDRVVFCYAGDLWTASVDGGGAVRLTSHPGRELFPRFSPDGQWIAFTGQIDGDEQVYVIPARGGEPRQLTWYPARGPLSPRWGFDQQVYGWTADGRSVLFRSLRDGWDLSDSRLYTVAVEGGLPVPLPMPVSGAGDLSPDGQQVVYAPLFRDFRTWKRYQGGWASDLWIFDVDGGGARQITDHPRSDRDPMWVGDRIVFNSDRDGKLNLYGYDLATGATTQLTQETEWDVRWPAADTQGRVIYELGGELHVLDLASNRSRALSIDVPTDGLGRRPRRVSASGQLEGWGLSPKGERAVVVGRGDVFSLPVEHGPTRNLTHSSDAHDRLASWSPDGKQIVFVSDRSGEEALWLVPQDGSGEARLLTDEATGRLYAPLWSPDASLIAYSDKEGMIRVVDASSGRVREVADEKQGQVTDYAWSPDSRFLTFSLQDPNGQNSIWIWDADDNRLRRVTGEMFNEYEPVFDPTGEYLFYLSDRGFSPQIGSFEWNYVVDRETGIFALALRAEGEHPFGPRSDEVEIEKAEEEKDEAKDEGDIEVEIDFEGLADRAVRVPVDFDNYYGLTAVDGHLLYVRGGPFYYGRGSDIEATVQLFSLEDREAKTVTTASGYALSQDGKKLLVRSGGGLALHDVSADSKGESISTGDMYCDIDPAVEWETMFDEVWRRYRDYFYVENMHGYDWEALGERYRALLPHVAHRSDLNYVLGEMVAELNVSHAYVSGGDYENPPRPRVALPGARFELDVRSGRYRIAEILHGQNEEDRYRSPLTALGVDVAEGDYVLAIDGEELRAPDNPYRMLRNKADRPVALSVNSRPSVDGAREVVFEPIRSEIPLRYFRWVDRNRRQVEESTDGRVGYLHVPDMSSNGIREFIKWFYGQIRKEGLVIDVRGNGGGNVSQMLIERLRRELLRVRYVRTREQPLTYPSSCYFGHLVCLLNETSASDGDVFPAMFQRAGLGPLIGKRSWGGVIGISGHGPLLDGGSVSVPQFGTNDLDGNWIIEGHGVDPDIEVENDPLSVIAGKDNQLERAIEEILRAMQNEPRAFPERATPPVRTH